MISVRALRLRTRLWAFDVSHGWLVRTAATWLLLLMGLGHSWLGRRRRGMRAMLSAHRAALPLQRSAAPTRVQRLAERAVARAVAAGDFDVLEADAYEADASIKDWLNRQGLVVKAPRQSGGRLERGVLLVKYTKAFTELANALDMGALLREYRLVLEPSSAGYAVADILQFARFAPEPIVVMATEERDFALLERLGANLVPVTFGASDWVDHRIFRPLPGVEKEFDAIMIAFWGMGKRHHALFRALRRLGDPTFRVALVGFPFGMQREDIELLADSYGVRRNLVFFDRMTPEELNACLNRAKVNLLLSLKEGSNKSIFEGFFAGVPGVILRENVGAAKHYLTPATGRLVAERDLPEALAWFREHWREYAPREWALANIAPAMTTEKLNRQLRAFADAAGEPWTTDIVVKVNAPEMTYADPDAARGLPEFAAEAARFARTAPSAPLSSSRT